MAISLLGSSSRAATSLQRSDSGVAITLSESDGEATTSLLGAYAVGLRHKQDVGD